MNSSTTTAQDDHSTCSEKHDSAALLSKPDLTGRIRASSQVRGFSADSEGAATNAIYKPKNSSKNDEVDVHDDEGDKPDGFWPSPILQRAMVESPREQGIIDWHSKYRSVNAAHASISSSTDSALGNRFGATELKQSDLGSPGSQKSIEDTESWTEDEDISKFDPRAFYTPGGSKKSVTFGRASIVSDSDDHSDYFSMSKCQKECITKLH